MAGTFRSLPILEIFRGLLRHHAGGRRSQRARRRSPGAWCCSTNSFADALPLLFDFLGVTDPQRQEMRLPARASTMCSRNSPLASSQPVPISISVTSLPLADVLDRLAHDRDQLDAGALPGRAVAPTLRIGDAEEVEEQRQRVAKLLSSSTMRPAIFSRALRSSSSSVMP